MRHEASGVPTSFLAYDTPALQHDQLTADLGIYAEDIWHYKRLAITPGIRWEYLSAEVQPESTPAGRFVPARSNGTINCDIIKGLGCFKDWTPRLGVVYDLFGNHKTAIKGDVSKYDIPLVDSVSTSSTPSTRPTRPFPGAILDARASAAIRLRPTSGSARFPRQTSGRW